MKIIKLSIIFTFKLGKTLAFNAGKLTYRHI